jgi:hypothetical protein
LALLGAERITIRQKTQINCPTKRLSGSFIDDLRAHAMESAELKSLRDAPKRSTIVSSHADHGKVIAERRGSRFCRALSVRGPTA